LLESLDAVAFGMLCDAYGGYLRIREELACEQLVLLSGDSNYPTANPLCALMRSQTKGLRELLSDFGLTPASRTSLTGSTSATPAEQADADPLSTLIEQMSQTAERPQRKQTPRKSRRVDGKK